MGITFDHQVTKIIFHFNTFSVSYGGRSVLYLPQSLPQVSKEVSDVGQWNSQSNRKTSYQEKMRLNV